ncbi:DUF547 domain-containing protein [Hyphococcus lacteus]|uniref:DUF547 domain-containing protein n=1 Tax=Hyphococcus lacteus TaxID=3143536 RepID=A0ABV3Z6R3_9PROT
MRKILFVFFSLLLSSHAHSQNLSALGKWTNTSDKTIDHSEWAIILETYVDANTEDGVNRFFYSEVTGPDKKRLKSYIKFLAQIDPTALNKEESFAYWANLYNALTVDLILDNYPIESIKDIKPSVFAFGPWKMDVVKVSGQELSLDDIEHGILRAYWTDARIHYAVNCASIGCPNLRAVPFSGQSLERDLESAARAYINHPRGAHVDSEGRLILSSIYDWYSDDFGESDSAIIAHLSLYADDDLASKLSSIKKIHNYNYDWSLNIANP